MKIAHLLTASVMAVAAYSFAAPAAYAQSQDSVVSGCASGGSCAQLVVAYANSLSAGGATQAQVDQAMVDLTVSLSNAAQANPAARPQIVAGINAAAQATGNAATRNQMVAIAQTIAEDGGLPATAASGA